jgi:hypothetical protein
MALHKREVVARLLQARKRTFNTEIRNYRYGGQPCTRYSAGSRQSVPVKIEPP